VPVVAIFTKFDALEDVAYGKLIKEGYPAQDAVGQTADRAVADFEREYLPLFRELEFPPKGHVYLRGNTSQSSSFKLQVLDPKQIVVNLAKLTYSIYATKQSRNMHEIRIGEVMLPY
jgi:hypothetical protein